MRSLCSPALWISRSPGDERTWERGEWERGSQNHSMRILIGSGCRRSYSSHTGWCWPRAACCWWWRASSKLRTTHGYCSSQTSRPPWQPFTSCTDRYCASTAHSKTDNKAVAAAARSVTAASPRNRTMTSSSWRRNTEGTSARPRATLRI